MLSAVTFAVFQMAINTRMVYGPMNMSAHSQGATLSCTPKAAFLGPFHNCNGVASGTCYFKVNLYSCAASIYLWWNETIFNFSVKYDELWQQCQSWQVFPLYWHLRWYETNMYLQTPHRVILKKNIRPCISSCHVSCQGIWWCLFSFCFTKMFLSIFCIFKFWTFPTIHEDTDLFM